MKKKVIIAMLLTMGIMSMGVVQASAYTVTGPTFSFTKGPDTQEDAGDWDEVYDAVRSAKDIDDWDEDDVNYYRQNIKESLAYLEKYGVTYDVNTGNIGYEGKTVRWILDGYGGNEWMTAGGSDGEIGLFVERNDHYEVTGVRVADREEFLEYGMDLDEDVRSGVVHSAVVAEEDTIVQDTQNPDTEIIFEEGTKYSGYEKKYSQAAETTEAISEGSYYEENDKKVKEYEKAGIMSDTDGSWLWKGHKVRMLLDDDGSLYSNGSAKLDEEKIYLIVNRDAYGDISKVQEISSKELMAYLALKED